MSDDNYIKRSECISTHKTLMDKIDLMAEKIEKILVKQASLPGDLIKEIDGKYVSQESFWPVKTVVYGLVGFLLLSIVGGLVALLLK